jgi:hypothetical protein
MTIYKIPISMIMNMNYDIDNIEVIKDDDVEVCQYLRPDGRKRKMTAPLGKEYHEKAKGLVISAEELMNGLIVIYIRREGQDPEDEQSRILTNDHAGVIDGFKAFIDEFIATP